MYADEKKEGEREGEKKNHTSNFADKGFFSFLISYEILIHTFDVTIRYWFL